MEPHRLCTVELPLFRLCTDQHGALCRLESLIEARVDSSSLCMANAKIVDTVAAVLEESARLSNDVGQREVEARAPSDEGGVE